MKVCSLNTICVGTHVSVNMYSAHLWCSSAGLHSLHSGDDDVTESPGVPKVNHMVDVSACQAKNRSCRQYGLAKTSRKGVA